MHTLEIFFYKKNEKKKNNKRYNKKTQNKVHWRPKPQTKKENKNSQKNEERKINDIVSDLGKININEKSEFKQKKEKRRKEGGKICK